MKKIILLVLILLCNILTVSARTWVQIDDNNYIDKDNIKIYINDHGQYDYNKRSFWIKYIGNNIYTEIEKIKNKKISYSLSQYIIDFQKQTITPKSVNTYDEEGLTITKYTCKDYQLEWEPIIPESNAEYWAELVKKPRTLKKMYKFQQIHNIITN